jgi:peptide/nickel transport system substrate-binding protein
MNKLYKYVFLIVIIYISSLLILSSCQINNENVARNLPEKTTNEDSSSPNLDNSILKIGHSLIIDTLNPSNAWENWAARYLWYDSIIEWGGFDRFFPSLAKDWQVLSDDRTWIFNIREGVFFQDGTPCTAEEIAWNINWQKENNFGTTIGYLVDIDSAEALDTYTLEIVLKEPVSNMITQKLPLIWILSPSVWKKVPKDLIGSYIEIDGTIGTGPYKLIDYAEDEYMVLERNNDYWGELPFIERIIWQQYTSDSGLILALKSGEIDVIHHVPPFAVKNLQDSPNINVVIMPTNRIDELTINFHENGTQPESLKDITVRKAISYAIDKEKIIKVAYLFAEKGTVIVPPSMGDYHYSDAPEIFYDPMIANSLLDEAGYKDLNKDGIREDKDGNPLEYRLFIYEGSTWARVAEIISKDLEVIGIKIKITSMDENALSAQVYPNFDYDLVYWYWGLDISDPNSALRLFLCEERLPGGWNDSGYCDESYDDLYWKQATTLDNTERISIVREMQKKILDDIPYVVVAYPKFIQAYRSDRFEFSEECGNILWKDCLLKVRSAY